MASHEIKANQSQIRVRSGLLLFFIVVVVLALAIFDKTGVAASLAGGRPAPSNFSVPDAMKSLYGNFDSATQMSISSVPAGSARSSFFDRADKIDVRPFFARSVKDSGRSKVFLLTYAVPDSESFGCHACAPLVGMTVFVRANNAWNIESLNKGVTVSGQWGAPPDARILRIGEHHVGIELRDAFQGAGEASVEVSILVPWKGEIREALSTEIEDDDHGTCGDGDLPCYRNRRKITFVKGADPEYKDIVVTLSGTALKKKEKPPIAIKVNEVEHRHFFEGKYSLAPH